MKNIIVKDGSLFVVPNSAQKAETIVEKIQNLVKKTNSFSISIDLSGCNMFEALKIASLTGAYGLINNLNNNYEIIVDDEIVMAQIQLLSLTNIKVNYRPQSEERIQTSKELVVVV